MRSSPLARAAAIALLAAGCNQLIGLDPGLDKPDAAGSGGATTSSASTGTSTSASTGGSGGTGGAMVCTPGTMMDCYTGLSGTDGVGQCKHGQATCAPDGSAFGACMGEVVPAAEDCATPGDEDCDGIGCSDLVWAHLYGDGAAQSADSVAVDAQGNIVVTGALVGSAVFGAQTLLSNGGTDVFVAKLDPAGTVVWAKRYGDTSGQSPGAIAVETQGNIVVGGHFNGTIDFGAGTLTSAGAGDVYVAKLSPSGAGIWSLRIGDVAAQNLAGVAVLPGGDVVIAGTFSGTVSFGATVLTNNGMGSDAFVARLDGATGAPLWAHRYFDSGGMQSTVPQALAIDGAGHVVLGGAFAGTVSFGSAALAGTTSRSIFLVALDSSGAALWSKPFTASQGSFKVMSLVATSAGEITIAGQAGGSTDFGGGATGTGGIYAAHFDSMGGYLWGRVFGGTGGSTINAAVDSAGNIALAGGFTGAMDFSQGVSPLVNAAATTDTFVAKLSPTGAHVWSKMFADTASPAVADAARGVAVDPVSQRVVVVGQQIGNVDYGGGMVTGIGGGDAWVSEFQP